MGFENNENRALWIGSEGESSYVGDVGGRVNDGATVRQDAVCATVNIVDRNMALPASWRAAITGVRWNSHDAADANGASRHDGVVLVAREGLHVPSDHLCVEGFGCLHVRGDQVVPNKGEDFVVMV